MKNISKNILILVLLGGMLFSSEAEAVVKLDFFALPESLLPRLERMKHKYEEDYNAQMNDLQKKVLKSTGAEGGAMYIIMQKELDGVVHQTADTMFQQIKSGHFDLSAFSDMYKRKGDSLLEWQQATRMLEDYNKARLQIQEEKTQAMKKRLLVLETQMQNDPTIKDNPEKQTELAAEIASLEAQIKAIELANAERDKKREEFERKVSNAADTIKRISRFEEELTKKATEGINQIADDLFPEKDENQKDENEALYGADVNKFFLSKYENENSTTISRIKQARDKEYYQAVQNVLRATTGSIVAGKDIEEVSKAYTKKTTEVDGLYGGMAMKIGADIQTAKAAARYTELLLAELRMSSMSEMRTWTSQYKLKDYNKDVTTLNLDNYVFKEQSLTEKLKQEARDGIQRGISGWKGL